MNIEFVAQGRTNAKTQAARELSKAPPDVLKAVQEQLDALPAEADVSYVDVKLTSQALTVRVLHKFIPF